MKFTLQNQKYAPIIIAVLIFTSLLFTPSTQAVADMFGILKKHDVYLSPLVNGRITLNGTAVPNQEIMRGLTYGDDDEIIDKTVTDTEGNFSFTEKNIRSSKPGSMFDESRIRQVINVNYQGKDYLLWYTQAIGITPNKGLTEKLKMLNCELTNTEEKITFLSSEYPGSNHLVYSICRWK